LKWFPVNPAYRVEAVFTPYTDSKSAKIPDTRNIPAPGFVTFVLDGRTLRSTFAPPPTITGISWYLMFKDATSGKETYGAGRYLHVESPNNGEAVVDFNRAYNPTCAVSPFYSCPIVPKDSSPACSGGSRRAVQSLLNSYLSGSAPR